MSLRPEPGEMRWMQLRVGLLAAVVLSLVAFAILRLDAVGSLFGSPVVFTVRLSDGLGLREGSQVTVAGLPAGIVSELTVVPSGRAAGTVVAARVKMKAEQFALLRDDTRSRVRALGLLGDRLLDFTPGTPSRRSLTAADTLDAESFAELGDLFSAADTALRAVTAVSGDLRVAAERLRKGDGTIGRLFTDAALYDTLLRTVRRADQVLAQVQGGRGTLGRMLRDTTLYGSITNAAVALDSAASLLNDRDGVLARLQQDTAFYTRLRRATVGIDSLVRGLNAGRGTAGQLLVERELYDRLLRVTAALDSLAADVKRNPSRYTKGAVRLF
ncbi:MAG: MlaD family protein [Gemmatimonadaceae bacterium]|nr:MlaD family protein [Gemmatimonadaceae bacterium]